MKPAENYILQQPEPFRSVLMYLQTVIEQTIPNAALMYKYKLPFYYVEGRPCCYLNCSNGYVDLGFWNAAHLTVHLDKMVTVGRKVIKSLRYTALEDIDEEVLVAVLKNAYEVRGEKFWGKN